MENNKRVQNYLPRVREEGQLEKPLLVTSYSQASSNHQDSDYHGLSSPTQLGASAFQEDFHLVGSLPPPKLGAKLVSDKRNLNIKRRLNESYLEYAAADGSQWRSEKKRRKKACSSPRRGGADLDRG
jgi:hypothetical protein